MQATGGLNTTVTTPADSTPEANPSDDTDDETEPDTGLTPNVLDTTTSNRSVRQPAATIDDQTPMSPLSTSRVARGTVIATITVGNGPSAVAVSPDGATAYVTNIFDRTLSVIDIDPASATYHTVTATITVGEAPENVALSPDGKLAYVVNRVSGSVTVIDTTTNTAVATIGGLDAPEGVAFTPDGRAYISDAVGLTVISLT